MEFAMVHHTSTAAEKEMIHLTVESRRQKLKSKLANAKFLSLLLDRPTDTANINNSLSLSCGALKMKVMRRFTREWNTSPLFNHTGLRMKTFSRCWRVVCRASAAKCLQLVGIGTDGASTNIAAWRLKGLVERCLCWVLRMWSMAHHLEMAIFCWGSIFSTKNCQKDAGSSKRSSLIWKGASALMKLESSQFVPVGLGRLHTSRQQWGEYSQKFGAYISHTAALSEDRPVRPADHVKLKGYYSKWADAKYPIGCALFVDTLTPCVTFCKCT